MSAEVLRRAAALMRERAEAATPGPWTCFGDHLVWPSEKGPAANDPILAMVGPDHDDSSEHIASWHPAVALAVADWLTYVADLAESNEKVLDEHAEANESGDGCDCAHKDCYEHGKWCHCDHARPRITEALAVARAYLGESA